MEFKILGANQTEVDFGTGTRVLVSYKTPVAAYVIGEGYIRSEESFSRTTGKHIGQWGAKEGRRVPQSELESLLNTGSVTNPRTMKRTKLPKPNPEGERAFQLKD